MKKSLKYREIIADARRVVVKVGSRVIIQKSGRPDLRRIRALAEEVAGIQRASREVVLVTSGAIGAGMEALGMKDRPKALPDLQMAAAVGQTRLMSRYDELFTDLGCTVGQVLLTHTDFEHKIRLTNARRTMERLLRHKVIPIVNENDVVADEEIKADLAVGDNDRMAAMLVNLIRADLLILLTTADGVRETLDSGRTRRIPYIETVTPSVFRHVSGGSTRHSKGGMGTKLKAARDVASSGCTVVIANGRKSKVLSHIMDGEDTGTIILAQS